VNTQPPILIALANQAIAAALAFGLAWIVSQIGIAAPLLVIVAGQGVIAAALGPRFGLAPWWVPVQLVLPVALAAAMLLALPSWLYLTVFTLLLLVFWNTGGERIPLYLTNSHTWKTLAELLPETKGGSFIDVGSGLGGTLIFLADQRPDMQFDGIESAPLPFLITKLRFVASPANVRYGNFWRVDFSPYRVVYCFLSPAPMAALYEKASTEMRSGSIFVSNSFPVPGVPADEVIRIDDARETELFLWRM